jgi:hypothetical protein
MAHLIHGLPMDSKMPAKGSRLIISLKNLLYFSQARNFLPLAQSHCPLSTPEKSPCRTAGPARTTMMEIQG